MNELLQEMQTVILKGICILPGSIAHFDISHPAAVQSAQAAVNSDNGRIFLVTQRNENVENPQEADLYRIGLVADIRHLIKLPKGALRLVVVGTRRAELAYFVESNTGMRSQVVLFANESEPCPADAEEAMMRSLKEALAGYIKVNPQVGEMIEHQPGDLEDLKTFMDVVGNCLPVPYQKKQSLLESISLEDRFTALMFILDQETDITEIKNEIQQKVKARIDKNQREYVLREQLKVIREELGEDDTESEVDQFMKEAEELDADESVKERLKKEIGHFRSYSSNMAESSVLRSWIETMLELPWNKRSEDSGDLARARQILDEDHYGLDEVKERVLEFLAVRHLTQGGESPILCLVGPPGTGKTSIAQSVARALGKQYVRISLGGVRDEAEIRGHRRTYVGAMPGRIVAGLKTAGVKNPLMLLDEIDKMSSDYKGDTASAMLEVLDSEQNVRFNDHYVDMPVDLSEVLFIATANDMQTIPRPLLDRMELIEVGSYTANEKLHIAKEHLVKKQRDVNGLSKEQITFTDEALEGIIECYTREAGVRTLERRIGQICRKGAREIYEGSKENIQVDRDDLEHYLGNEKFRSDEKNEEDEIGIARGLAWTSVGGTTLQIEVNVMPGKGGFKLTGQLGDVMKESAEAGISFIRSVSAEYGIDDSFFTEYDIHIHIPEGGVPKDGPSAGITMATAMLSAITGRKVRSDVAMTGEITLRGRVLPVGGLKEKLLAAKTAGIRTVCVPEKNRGDIEEVSEEIREGMEIVFVSSMEEVLGTALV
ncbi:MAG: endopeptidase La [Lachnospiraceae bacterium]|nr:endopeptidase La [Lachnospiraceae bacterium]